MAKVDGEQHFNQTHSLLVDLWLGGDITKVEDFRKFCFALDSMNAALRSALNDIHNHVRQQQSATQSTPPARIYGR
jgi:hypothetical protein